MLSVLSVFSCVLRIMRDKKGDGVAICCMGRKVGIVSAGASDGTGVAAGFGRGGIGRGTRVVGLSLGLLLTNWYMQSVTCGSTAKQVAKVVSGPRSMHFRAALPHTRVLVQ